MYDIVRIVPRSANQSILSGRSATFSFLEDNEILLSVLQTVYLPGHPEHSVGFLHLPSGTLLSGDCLQLKGIGKFRKNIADRAAHERSVEKLMTIPIHKIVAAHKFDPLGSLAPGKNKVQTYLEMCLKYW